MCTNLTLFVIHNLFGSSLKARLNSFNCSGNTKVVGKYGNSLTPYSSIKVLRFKCICLLSFRAPNCGRKLYFQYFTSYLKFLNRFTWVAVLQDSIGPSTLAGKPWIAKIRTWLSHESWLMTCECVFGLCSVAYTL